MKDKTIDQIFDEFFKSIALNKISIIQLGDNAKILDKDGKIISEEKFRKIIWKRSIKEKLENISKKQD
jgi:hypothetical protein